MIGIKRKFVYASPLLATILLGIAFIAWPGPFLPEAIRGLAPDNTHLAELSRGSDALAKRRGGGRGGRGGRGGGFKRSGPSSQGSVHTSRGRQSTTKWSSGGSRGSFQRVDRGGRGGRRGTRPDQRGDRREFRQDVRKERRDVRKERHEWYEDRWRRRAGAFLTVTTFRALTCATRTVVVNGVTYFGCGTTWYNRAYQSGQVVYVIVIPPPGY